MIKLIEVSKYYKDKCIFNKVSLNLNLDSPLCIYGESGIGKSTLCNMIMGIDKDYEGVINFYGDDPISISYMAQTNTLITYYTVEQNLLAFTNATSQEVDSILVQMEILDLKEELVNNISGGEKQRVNLARAILQKPNLIILDEPTAGLDNVTTTGILELLDEVFNDGMKLIIISHDLRLQEYYQHNLLELCDNSFMYSNKNRSSDLNQVTSSLIDVDNNNLLNYSKKYHKVFSRKLILMFSLLLSLFLLLVLSYTSDTTQLYAFIDELYGVNSGIISNTATNFEKDTTVDIVGYPWTAYGYTLIPGYHYFTQEELDYIAAYEGLENYVFQYISPTANSYNSYKNGKTAKVIEVGNVNYSILTLPADIDLLKDYGASLNETFNSDFIYGNPSSLAYNDIVLPLNFAEYLAGERGVAVEDLIGMTYSASSSEGGYIDYNIAAIYDENKFYQSTDGTEQGHLYAGPLTDPTQNIAYYPIDDYPYVNGKMSEEEYTLKKPGSMYIDFIESNEEDALNYELINALAADYSSQENLEASFHTGVSNVYYHLKDGYTHQDFEQYLLNGPEPLPIRYIDNAYELKTNKSYNDLYRYITLTIMMIIILIIITYFAINSLIKHLTNELAVAKMLGFSEKKSIYFYHSHINDIFFYSIVLANIIAIFLIELFRHYGFVIYFNLLQLILINGIVILVLGLISLFNRRKIRRLKFNKIQETI